MADPAGIGDVRAVLKRLDLDPNPATLPGDPAEFSLLARMIVGTPDTPAEDAARNPAWPGTQQGQFT